MHVAYFAMTLVFGFSLSLYLMYLKPNEGEIRAPVVSDVKALVAPLQPPLTSPNSIIREVDFENFSYPSAIVYPSVIVGERPFKLRNGELLPKRKDKIGRPLDIWLKLANVTYGDVTGDGVEEAIVDLGWITGGTATPDLVYIYGWRSGKARLLWAFETGDRAEGGYKDVFAENGELVVELQGKDKVIGWNLYADDGTRTGLCCPTYFTRTRYRWVRNRFRQYRKPEVLPLKL